MSLTPDLVLDSAHEATPELLRSLGVRAVLVDLDDTLVPSGGGASHPACAPWFESLRAAGIRSLILSNGTRARVAACCESFGTEGFPLVGKPFGFAYRRGLARLGTRPSETAMIGDQLFTDILGANLAGLVTILVRPLTPGGLPHTRAVRRLERLILGGDHGRPLDR